MGSGRFHLEHGAYCEPPGRAMCALQAARAELEAKERGWIVCCQSDEDGWATYSALDAYWVAALIVWGLFYPVVTAFVGTVGSVAANMFSLALAIVTIIRVWPASMAAVAMIAPSIIWLCIANAFGFAALEGAS